VIPLSPDEAPKGTIAVVSSELSRYATFAASLAKLLRDSYPYAEFVWTRGHSVVENRNNAVAHMLGDWLAFLDDDMVFHPELLRQLLARGDQYDILGALYCDRKPPFKPVVFLPGDRPGTLQSLAWTQLPPQSHGVWVLPPGSAIGTQGMLIRRRVLDAIGPPWFEGGKLDPNEVAEDMWFCLRAQQLGFRVAVDLETITGHTTATTIWPDWSSEDGWGILADFEKGLTARFDFTYEAPPT
jgi:cellulose synthase/poly-beta-1,6-N-acetylglucosamine synthase-like glycosyltransferase